MLTRTDFLKYTVPVVLAFGLFSSCKNREKTVPVAFESLGAEQTGIRFTNKLTPSASFNMFKYMYFYNGAGVGAGDFNNDGQTDLFFASNQGRCQLYLNEGKLHFRDVTAAAGIPDDGGWSTGVSVVDINNDGLLDIYVCRVGKYETLKSQNLLLVCQKIGADGVPVYQEQAARWGLQFSGFSTQAVFFDMDLDGDLDCYLLNHSLRFNGTFAERSSYANTYDSVAGDRLFRNDGNHYTDITRSSGINSSIIGYGLGISVSDINLDGYPDLYIGNDFHENDYLYINQHNGSFRDTLNDAIMHTSQFSMGVDVADADNDGWPEIISMDMLPYDPYILKRSLGEDAYDIFTFKIRHGYNYQYARNNLQWNRRNGLFSETGLYSGVYATDWSWAPLWMDFDNDGRKDLFISNGIPKRLNDIDYVNFASNEELQQKIRENRLDDKDMALVNTFPEIKLPNQFFANRGKLSFEKINEAVQGDLPTFSNGAVYADLDNDGDQDIVVNNIDDPVLIYRNTANDKQEAPALRLQLEGPQNNRNAIGARLLVYDSAGIHTYEKYPVRGFQSSMEIPLQAGMKQSRPDSLVLIWPDGSYEKLDTAGGLNRKLKYHKGLPGFDFAGFRSASGLKGVPHWEDITAKTGLDWKHEENPFVEFDREPLIPHMVSKEGPALAVADINGDGREDLFVGASKTYRPGLFLQTPDGKLVRSQQPALDADTMYEETDAVWQDVNNDHYPDLILASGGNEYYGEDRHMSPRLFLNNAQGLLTEQQDAFAGIYLTASCVLPYDFNGDGFTDLFFGGRAVPWEYGATPQSYLLQNDGKGHFTDVTSAVAKELGQAGFVTGGCWSDIDGDKDLDLVLSMEWGPVTAFINDKGRFIRKNLTTGNGWWQTVQPVDIDNDGDIDLVAGNLGWNSRLRATAQEPLRLYYADFDGNGKKEQLLTYNLNGKELVFANKDELQKQLPLLKKKFLYAADFAKADLETLVGKEKLKEAEVLTATEMSNALLVNDGKGNFSLSPFPWQAQLSPYRCFQVSDFNQDGRQDLLCMGNFYGSNIQMGRYDADFGSVLLNKGNAQFSDPLPLQWKGEIRKARALQLNGKPVLVLARNNDSLRVVRFGN